MIRAGDVVLKARPHYCRSQMEQKTSSGIDWTPTQRSTHLHWSLYTAGWDENRFTGESA